MAQKPTKPKKTKKENKMDQKQIMKQMLEMNKLACDNTFMTITTIQEQTEKDLATEGRELPHEAGHDVLRWMVKEQKRLGRGQGAGFYEYPQDGDKYLWPELQEHFPLEGEKLSQSEMIERLMFVQALDAARCLEEGVLTSVADANIGSIFGWGFAPFKGGALQYTNDYGVTAFVEHSRALADKWGERFTPPSLLIEMAEKSETF